MGEAAAGTRVAELLETMGAEGVIVLVSRECYGGMLGGVRFSHFLHCAGELLRACGHDVKGGGASKGGKQKQKQKHQSKGQPGSYELRPNSEKAAPPQLHYVPTKQQASYTKSHMEHG